MYGLGYTTFKVSNSKWQAYLDAYKGINPVTGAYVTDSELQAQLGMSEEELWFYKSLYQGLMSYFGASVIGEQRALSMIPRDVVTARNLLSDRQLAFEQYAVYPEGVVLPSISVAQVEQTVTPTPIPSASTSVTAAAPTVPIETGAATRQVISEIEATAAAVAPVPSGVEPVPSAAVAPSSVIESIANGFKKPLPVFETVSAEKAGVAVTTTEKVSPVVLLGIGALGILVLRKLLV